MLNKIRTKPTNQIINSFTLATAEEQSAKRSLVLTLSTQAPHHIYYHAVTNANNLVIVMIVHPVMKRFKNNKFVNVIAINYSMRFHASKEIKSFLLLLVKKYAIDGCHVGITARKCVNTTHVVVR